MTRAIGEPRGETGGESTAGSTRNALATIASKAALPAARVLCKSFLQYCPTGRAHVLLLDAAPAGLDSNSDVEPFTLTHLDALRLPDSPDFLFQYTQTQAQRAVIPYFLAHLLATRAADKIVYLEPDTWLRSALSEVWEALDDKDLVLSPHVLGVRRGVVGARRLAAWASDVAADTAPAQGWPKIPPSDLPHVATLRVPTYLVGDPAVRGHQISRSPSGAYCLDGKRIALFRFNGFVSTPLPLHQAAVRYTGAVRELCRAYTNALAAAGHAALAGAAYAFDRLPDGLRVTDGLRHMIRQARQQQQPLPSVAATHQFAEFLLTPTSQSGSELPPLFDLILTERPDVAALFPTARQDFRTSGLIDWFEHHGQHAYNWSGPFARHRHCLDRGDPFLTVRRLYRARVDLQQAYPNAFLPAGLAPFVTWLRNHGVHEAGLTPREVDTFAAAEVGSVDRLLACYLQSPYAHDPAALLPPCAAFVAWMLQEGGARCGVSTTQIYWFEHRIQADPEPVLQFLALRHPTLRRNLPLASMPFGWADACGWAQQRLGPGVSWAQVRPPPLSVLQQLEIVYTTGAYRQLFPHAFADTAQLTALTRAVIRTWEKSLTPRTTAALLDVARRYEPLPGVNIAGHFNDPDSAGQAARALADALSVAKVTQHQVTVPALRALTLSDDWRSYHAVAHRTSITLTNVAASDDVTMHHNGVRAVCDYLGPAYFEGRRKIGYWLWDGTPLDADCAAHARSFDAIWAASQHAARTFAAAIAPQIPIHVVPHPVTVPTALPAGNKTRFGLPSHRLLLGCLVSGPRAAERQNPHDVCTAFRRAFRRDDKVVLVIHMEPGSALPRELAALRHLNADLPIVWLTQPLDAARREALLACIDVVVSLHHVEGFGLTLAHAMAQGKPVIATGYSGNLEFMNDRCARLVPYHRVEARTDGIRDITGRLWAQPDVDMAAAIMRTLYLSPELRVELGQCGRAHIAARLAPAVIGARMRQLLDDDHGAGAMRTPPARHAAPPASNIEATSNSQSHAPMQSVSI